MKFEHRTVILTGAAGNLGRAVAAAFIERGASLVLIDRQREPLMQAFGAPSPRMQLVAANLLDAAEVDAAAAAAMREFGRIDVLVNIAGGFRMGELVHETSEKTWNFLFDINVRTLLNTVHAIAPRMIDSGGGKIVNVGAYGALKAAPKMGAYAASKSSVIRLTEAMDAELRSHNVNVNCVLPTLIDTPENRAAMPNADRRDWVGPDDLANVIVFLASDAARAVHGAAIPVGATA